MHPILRLYEDVLSSGDAASRVRLPALARMIFVVHGAVDHRRQDAQRRRSLARRGRVRRSRRARTASRCWRFELARGEQRQHHCQRAAACARRRSSPPRSKPCPQGELLLRGDSVAFPPGGCAFTAQASGPGHPLPDRRRHPHRHARPLDLLRAGQRLVRDRPRSGVRAGRDGPAEPLHPRHDPAARAARQKLVPVTSTKRTRPSRRRRAVQDLRRRADRSSRRRSERSTASRPFPAPRRWRPRCASMRRGWNDYLAAHMRGLCRPADGQAVQGRPVEPDLSAGNAGAALRAAPQAARQAAAVGACGRPRIPRRSARCIAQGFPVAEPLLYCADESVAGTAFYVMGFVDGRVFWEPQMPGSNPAERARGLRRDERDAGAAAYVRSGGNRPWRFRQRRELRRAPGRALVEAIPRLGDRKDRRDGAADRAGCRRTSPPAGPPRLVHGDYRLDNLIARARRAEGRSPCSTGNCRRSAIRSPISPII